MYLLPADFFFFLKEAPAKGEPPSIGLRDRKFTRGWVRGLGSTAQIGLLSRFWNTVAVKAGDAAAQSTRYKKISLSGLPLFQSPCQQLQKKTSKLIRGVRLSWVGTHISFLIQDNQLTDIHYCRPEINWGYSLISWKLDFWKVLILLVSWGKTYQLWGLINLLSSSSSPCFFSTPLQARVDILLGWLLWQTWILAELFLQCTALLHLTETWTVLLLTPHHT